MNHKKYIAIFLFLSYSFVYGQKNYTKETIQFIESKYEFFSSVEYDSCLKYSLQLMQIHQETDDFEDQYLSHLLMHAYALEINALFQLSLNSYLESLKLVKDQEQKLDILHNIGLLYDEIGDYRAANIYYQKVLAIEKDPLDIALTYHALGDNYIYLNKLDSSILCFEKAIEIYNNENELERLALVHFAAMESYVKTNDTSKVFKASQYFDLPEKTNFELYTLGYENLAKGFYFQFNRNYDSSLHYFKKTINDAIELGYTKGIKQISISIIDLALEYKDYETAYKYLNIKDSINQKILSEKELNYIKQHEISYKTYLKDKEIEIANLTLQSQRKTINFFIILALALAMISIVILFFTRKLNLLNKSLKQKSDQIAFLFKELNHRVKNNLQLLSSIIGLQSNAIESDETKKVLKSLKDRVHSMSIVHDKIEAIDDTIILNKFTQDLFVSLIQSFDSNVKFINQIDNIKINTNKMSLLSLILNEIFTNFLKYGKTNSNPSLTIVSQLNEDGLLLEIKDNGNATESTENKKSLGNMIIKTLIKQLNGTYTLTTENGYHYHIFIPNQKDFRIEKIN